MLLLLLLLPVRQVLLALLLALLPLVSVEFVLFSVLSLLLPIQSPLLVTGLLILFVKICITSVLLQRYEVEDTILIIIHLL